MRCNPTIEPLQHIPCARVPRYLLHLIDSPPHSLLMAPPLRAAPPHLQAGSEHQLQHADVVRAVLACRADRRERRLHS